MLHPRSEGVKGVCFVRPVDIDRCCYRMIVNMQGIILRKGYRRYPSSERTEGERANICASAAQLTIPEKKNLCKRHEVERQLTMPEHFCKRAKRALANAARASVPASRAS